MPVFLRVKEAIGVSVSTTAVGSMCKRMQIALSAFIGIVSIPHRTYLRGSGTKRKMHLEHSCYFRPLVECWLDYSSVARKARGLVQHSDLAEVLSEFLHCNNEALWCLAKMSSDHDCS